MAAVPVFGGFALPTSNTTYCPNQFFDVCLPHYSRGTVRLVAHLLRRTLGWCDAEGQPQRERFTLTYAELEHDAGVSRDMIKTALAEAEKGCFVRCLRRPGAKKAGQPAVSGLFELRWDERPEYVKDPKLFRGFFAGEGNRTYIPNQFFDHVVRQEPLAVLKVVGSVIRFSIGFANKWGHRRQQVALSYQDIQRYSKIRNRTNLKQALDCAIAAHYLLRVEPGFFDPHGGLQSKAATYALKWLGEAALETLGRKSVPAEPAWADRSETGTGIGRKNAPADRSEKCTDIQITRTNNNSKGAGAQAIAASFEELRKAGFDEAAARTIARKYPVERVLRQIEWLGLRRARRNPLGMLRRAIEEDWARPERSGMPGRIEQLGVPNSAGREGGVCSLADALTEARRRLSEPPTRDRLSTSSTP